MNAIRKRQADPTLRFSIYIRDSGICQYCEVKLDLNNYHVDHVRAYCHGGETSESNLVTSCRMCNIAKNTMSAHLYKSMLNKYGINWRRKRFFAVMNSYMMKKSI